MSDASRLELLAHALNLAVEVETLARSIVRVDEESSKQAEQVLMLGNRLNKALRKADSIDAWRPPFEAAQPAAEAVQLQWAGLARLRNAYEHAEDRFANPLHPDRGSPTWVGRVLGVEVPLFAELTAVDADGLIGLRLFGVYGDIRPAIDAVTALRRAMAAILLDEDGNIRAHAL